jgi:hypothetical protein
MVLDKLSLRIKTLWHTLLLGVLVVFGLAIALSPHSDAATGINQQINFQGRLLNSQGAIVADGFYNVEFKIYQDGDGCVSSGTAPCSGTLKWTESHLNANSQGVQVKNGFMSVQLGSITAFGSSIDWNQDSLWLSLNIGNTNGSCTPFSSCGGDGEMVPFKRLSSNVYALNSGLLGGLASNQFVQLAQGLQTDSGNSVNSISINKTGTGGNFLSLQANGTDAFTVNNSGNIVFGNNVNRTISVTTSDAGLAGRSLTLTAGTAGSGGSALTGGDLVLQGGTGGGTNGNGGNVNIDGGVKNGTGTDGNISIGTNNAGSITIGKTGVATTVNGSLVAANTLSVGSSTAPTSGVAYFNGSVGIGSSAPAYQLEVVNSSGSASQLHVSTSTADTGAYFLGLTVSSHWSTNAAYNGTSWVAKATSTSVLSQTASGGLTFSSNSSLTVGSSFTPTNRLIVTSTGGLTATGTGTFQGNSVSIGTSSLAGSLILQDGSAHTITLNTPTSSTYSLSLPTGGATGNQCLQSTSGSTSSTSALQWGGCGSTYSGTDFIVNGTSVQAAANYYIRSNGDTVTGVLEGSNGQTADLLRLNTYNGTSSSTVAKFTSNGSLSITNGSASALAIKNSSGNSVLTVDSSGNQTILGQSSSVNGSLVFKNSASSNAITLNSTAANSNYTLTLPSSAPAAGLCLETSTIDSSQLVFASCTNNNASIQKVANWDTNNTNTLNISPSAVGDEIVLTTQIPTGGVTVTGVSGGGVGSWTKAVANNGNGTVNRVEMWIGTVSSTGSSTITVTYSSAPGVNEITATEFTAAGVNASTSWGIVNASSQLNSSSSSTVTFPNLLAVNGFELYVGYGQVQNPPATAGSTTGFNYIQTSTQHNMLTYNTSTNANTPYQPTANQNSAGQSNTVGAILTAFVSSTSINNTTSLQKANFYVQAATSGSVAGVLQAASSGTANILELRDSSANNVLTVGYTGNLTVKPSASTTAFQVQNSSGNGVLTVDTSNNRTLLGSANNMAGVLAFSNASNSNTITITAPASVAASYTLSLPSDTPTAGLCLGTSPSNANQLIFASCATQVSAASITYVNQWSNSGTSITTLADSPASAGNLLVLYSHSTNSVSITGISGGGVTNWTKVTSNVGGAGQGNNEMWRGVVTGTGSGTITVTYSAAAGANEITAQEFTMGGSGGGTWAVDTSGVTTGSSTTVNYPNLTPTNSSELYTGYAWSQNTMSAGSTSGFTYTATSGSKYTAYDTSVTGGVATQPTASQSVSGNYNSIAALIQAYAGTSVIVNGTATQQANFNVQAALSGTVAGILQGASSGTADIFQAKDGNANNILSVNSSSGVTLGTASAVTGSLTFANSGNSNTITIDSPTNVGQSYTLTLPSATPAAGQCLAAGSANPNQLVFSSCANQVTSVAISHVNSWNASGNAISTINVSPVNVGDLMIFISSPNSATSVASVSGGGVSTWTKVTGITNGSGSATSSIEMWRGIVTSTGASTISVTYNNPAGNPNELAAMEFTTGSATGSWVVDASSAQYNSTSSTTVDFPNLTPQSTKDLYVGYAAAGANITAGSTSGYTYLSGSLTSRIGLYNTSVSAASQPTAVRATSGTSISVGALIAAYSSSSVIANTTVTQQANLNVQAALSNSVAATLQAGQSGTADVVQILDVSGTVVDSFSNTGNLLIKPSTASANAIRVQTTGGVNVLSVDTSSSLVVVGAGSTGEANPSLLVLDNRTGTSNDPTVLNGAMYYNATSHSFRCGVDGAWQTCSGLLYSNTSNSSTNNNCTNNCSAFSTSASIPANYCQPGRVIKLHATGYFSSAATPANLQFGVYYGTSSSSAASNTQIGTLPTAQTVTSASNNYFQLSYNIICFSTTSMQGEGTMTIQTSTSGSSMSVIPMNSTTATTVVSSSAKNLYIFPIWDTASTSNSATITQYTVNAD